jgi:glycosyltransferase involved in cell wall biosynthesis
MGEQDEIWAVNDQDGAGKGYVIREGLKNANADYYIFIDGDGDINPRQISRIVYYLRCGYDVVVGKKELPQRLGRKILTWASRIWIRMLFGINVDTQTGLKGFNYKPEWVTDGWAFDIEILYKAKKAGKAMKEVPVHAIVSSGKNWKDIWSTLVDTVKIRMAL